MANILIDIVHILTNTTDIFKYRFRIGTFQYIVPIRIGWYFILWLWLKKEKQNKTKIEALFWVF